MHAARLALRLGAPVGLVFVPSAPLVGKTRPTPRIVKLSGLTVGPYPTIES